MVTVADRAEIERELTREVDGVFYTYDEGWGLPVHGVTPRLGDVLTAVDRVIARQEASYAEMHEYFEQQRKGRTLEDEWRWARYFQVQDLLHEWSEFGRKSDLDRAWASMSLLRKQVEQNETQPKSTCQHEWGPIEDEVQGMSTRRCSNCQTRRMTSLQVEEVED